MTYEMQRIASDPFDIACDDCPVHEITWWEEVSEEELREIHEWDIAADLSYPPALRQALIEDGQWEVPEPVFEDWLKKAITDGYVRVKE